MIDSILFEYLLEQNVLKTTQTKPIVDAIKNKRKITFDYYGPRKPKKDSVKPGKRINAEPYAIGLSKRGNLILRAWVEPPSVSKKGFQKTNWRTFMITRMKNILITNTPFEGNRPGYKEGSDGSMTVTYVSLNKSTQPKPVPKKIDKPIPSLGKIEQPPTEKKPLPQPKPEKKPPTLPDNNQKTAISEPSKELPQPKPETKPDIKPDETKKTDTEQNKNLQEKLNRIKYLILN